MKVAFMDSRISMLCGHLRNMGAKYGSQELLKGSTYDNLNQKQLYDMSCFSWVCHLSTVDIQILYTFAKTL